MDPAVRCLNLKTCLNYLSVPYNPVGIIYREEVEGYSQSTVLQRLLQYYHKYYQLRILCENKLKSQSYKKKNK